MDKAFVYLAAFVAVNMLVIALAAIPTKYWKSKI
jgi:hypothetical protein